MFENSIENHRNCPNLTGQKRHSETSEQDTYPNQSSYIAYSQHHMYSTHTFVTIIFYDFLYYFILMQWEYFGKC